MSTPTLFAGLWPDASTVKVRGGLYHTPEGPFPRVTGALKTVGLGVEGLIKWSANSERAAVLEACALAHYDHRSRATVKPSEFVSDVEARLGSTRAHQRLLAKAGDIGQEIHSRIQWHLNRDLGVNVGPEPKLSEAAAIGFTSWRAWWVESGLKPIRIEQPVWDPEWGYAGTIDLIAQAPDGVLEVWDWKSASGVYETHHMQLAAYIRAALRWAEVRPGCIVWLPKSAAGSLEVKVHGLGHLYGGKVRSYDELLGGFQAALTLHKLFVA